jgi:hypothetical protein
MVRWRMLKIIRPKQTSQSAVVTGSKWNKWDNLNNIRRKTSRHFKNKNREYLKDKIDELATNSKNKNIRDCYNSSLVTWTVALNWLFWESRYRAVAQTTQITQPLLLEVFTKPSLSNGRGVDRIENSLSIEFCLPRHCLAMLWANPL